MTEETSTSYLEELSEAEIFYRLNGITPRSPARAPEMVMIEPEWHSSMHVYKNSIQRALGRANCHSLDHIPMDSSVVVI